MIFNCSVVKDSSKDSALSDECKRSFTQNCKCCLPCEEVAASVAATMAAAKELVCVDGDTELSLAVVRLLPSIEATKKNIKIKLNEEWGGCILYK